MSSVRARRQTRARTLQRNNMNQDKDKACPSTSNTSTSGGRPPGEASGGIRKEKRTLADLEEKATNPKKQRLNDNNSHSFGATANVEDEASNPGGKDTTISPALKALKNNVVMSMIAKNLPAEDLNTLRQTCVLWNECFLPELQQKQNPLKLNNGEGSWLEPFGGVRGREYGRLQDYTDLVRSSPQIPFTNYKISDLTATRHRTFRDFFTVCDKSIRRLHLRNDWETEQAVNVDKLRQVFFELTPELEELRFNIDEDWGTSPVWNKRPKIRLFKKVPKLRKLGLTLNGPLHTAYQELLQDLLQCAVGLEGLSLVDGSHSNNTAILSILRDFPRCLRKLKTLKMYLLLVEEFRALIELARRKENPLRLEQLATSILGYFAEPEDQAESVEFLHTFLASQRATLRKLDLEIEGLVADRNLPVIRIPKMDALNSLILRRQGQRMITVQYDGETFANNFPSLKEVEYNFVSFTPKDLSEGDICGNDLAQIVHDGVTHLNIAVCYYGLSISSLAVALPSVTTLDFGLTNSTIKAISAVWTAWPALSSLQLRYLEESMRNTVLDLDFLLTGVPKSKFKTLTRTFEKGKEPFTLDSVRKLLSSHKTAPGLSDLKHLRELVLDVRGTSYKITDIGGYLGLAMASPTMQHMEIQHESKEAIREIYDRFMRSPHQKNLISAQCCDLIKSALHPCAVVIL